MIAALTTACPATSAATSCTDTGSLRTSFVGCDRRPPTARTPPWVRWPPQVHHSRLPTRNDFHVALPFLWNASHGHANTANGLAFGLAKGHDEMKSTPLSRFDSKPPTKLHFGLVHRQWIGLWISRRSRRNEIDTVKPFRFETTHKVALWISVLREILGPLKQVFRRTFQKCRARPNLESRLATW